MSHDPKHTRTEPAIEETQEETKDLSDLSRQAREEMKALSLQVFGSSSRWKTILDKGICQKTSGPHSEMKYYSFGELKAIMLGLKSQQEAKARDEADAKTAEDVQAAAGGSAL